MEGTLEPVITMWKYLFLIGFAIAAAFILTGLFLWVFCSPDRPLSRACRRIQECFWILVGGTLNAMSAGGRRLPSSELLPPDLSGGVPVGEARSFAPNGRNFKHTFGLRMMRGGRRGG